MVSSIYSILCFVILPLVVCDSLVCKQSQVPLSIVRTYGANKNEETFELWKDSPSSGTLITLYNGKQAEESEITIDICVEKGTYTLILSDSSSNGWDQASRLTVTLFGSYKQVDMTLDSFGERTIWLDCNWLIDPNTSWKYSDSYANGWKSTSFDDSAWNEAAAGSFTPVSGSTITRYYRVVISSISIPAVFSGFRIGAKTNIGLACYLNGEELFRRNLPSGQISDVTPAQTSLPTPVFYYSSLATLSSLQSTIVVSCEVHDCLIHTEHDDEFVSYAHFLPTDSRGFYRVHDFELLYSRDQSIVLDPLTDDDRRTSVTLLTNSWLMFTVPNEAYA